MVTVTAVLAAMLAVLALHLATGPMPIHAIIATVIGVVGTVMLGGTLMALAFMSAGTGHDREVQDWSENKDG